MSQVSKRNVDKKVFDRINELFVSIIATANDPKLSSFLIDDLLTSTEKIMLAKRLSIMLLINEGYNHRDISNILKVSTNTVNSVKRFYKGKTSSVNQMFNKIKRNEKMKETLIQIGEEAINILGRGPRVKNYILENSIKRDRKQREKPF